MKTSFLRPLSGTFLLTGILLGSISSANADTATMTWLWNGSSSTAWDTPSNWSLQPGGTGATTYPSTYNDVAVFSGTPAINPLLSNSKHYFDELVFTTATGGWVIGSAGSSSNIYLRPDTLVTQIVIDASLQTSGTTTINPLITVNATQTWVVGTGGTLVISGSINGGAALTLGSASSQGTIVLNGDNAAYAGRIQLGGGTVSLGSDTAGGAANKVISFISSSTLTTSGSHALVNNVYIGSALTGTILVGATDALTLSGIISDPSGPGSLLKSGAGTLTLSGLNTYRGTTTVSAGKLAVNGKLLTTGNVTVASGGILGGSGTVGKVSVESGGHFAAGNSITTTFTTTSLSLADGSITDVELGTASADRAAANTSLTNDRTTVTGALALGGTLNLTNNGDAGGLGSAGAGSYLIFTAGSVTGSFGSNIVNVTGYHAKVDTATPGSVYVDNYQIAAASALPAIPVSLGITHVGKAFTSSTLSIQNTATSATYSEKLNATVTGTTNAATATGSIAGLAGGGTSTDITVGLSDTTVGAKTGTVTVGFTSDGTTNSGYGETTLSSQSVTVNGQVNYYAAPAFAKSGGDGTWSVVSGTSYKLSLGTYDWNAGSKTFTTTLTLTNTLSDAIYQDILNGNLTLSGAAGLTLTEASAVSLASGSSKALTLSFNTAGITTSGSYGGLLTLNGTSTNLSGSEQLNPVSVALELQVVPEPATWAMILGGMGMMAFVQRARRRMSR